MNLFEAFMCLENPKEVEKFLKDLCTPKEIKDFQDRWEIAKILDKGQSSYREISEQTGASLTTVTRVARFLKDEKNKGYATVLKRMKQQNDAN